MHALDRANLVICGLVAILAALAVLVLPPGPPASLYAADPAVEPELALTDPAESTMSAELVSRERVERESLEIREPLIAQDFDPAPGDGKEHPGEAGLAIDGDPGTAWRTEPYGDGGLADVGKTGVGLALDLGRPFRAEAMRIATATPGWDATIHVTDRRFAGWGKPVGSVSRTSRHETVRLHLKRKKRYYLIWITDLGEHDSVALNELGAVADR